MPNISIFARIRKVDEEQRLVFGEMTSETLDKSKEIMDYDTSKPYFEKWSAAAKQAAAAVGAESLGNVRAMHQPIAAGKVVGMDFQDDARKIDICAKVVDDNEWNKVLEGVYTGFSIGGSYVKRWADKTIKGATRFTVNPVEVSLVDNPCVDTARFFDIVKVGGAVVQKAFLIPETHMDPTNEEVAARAAEMAKAAGDPAKWTGLLDEARAALVAEKAAPAETVVADEEEPVVAELTAAIAAAIAAEEAAKAAAAVDEPDPTTALKTVPTQVWQAPDGQVFAKKVDAIAHIASTAETPATLNPVQAALAAAKAITADEPVAELAVNPLEEIHLEATKWHGILVQAQTTFAEHVVVKGLYTVSRLAELLDCLGSVTSSAAYEAEYEKDGSGVPAQLANGLKVLGAALVAMAQEEVAEILQDLATRGVALEAILVADGIVELSAAVEMVKADTALMEKVGARNSAKDAAALQAIHDNAVQMGAACDTADKAALELEVTKRAESDPVLKALLDERDALKVQVGEAVEGIGDLAKSMATMKEDMEKLKRTPTEMAPKTGVVEKGAGADGAVLTVATAEAAVAELMKTAEGRDKLANAAIRASQENGHTI